MASDMETVATRRTIFDRPNLEGAVLQIRALGITPTEASYTPRRQFVFPVSGVHFLNDGLSDLLVDMNQIAIVREDSVTQDRHPSLGDMTCLIVTPDEATLEELGVEPPSPWAEGCYCMPMSAVTQIRAKLLSTGAGQTVGPGLEEALLNLVSASAGVGPAARAAGAKRTRLIRLIKEFLSSDMQPICLEKTASEFGVSPAYLTSIFHQVEGVPLYRYHLRLRLAEALNLLPAADDITALALDLGFSSHSHFSSAFRAHFKISPSQFRAMSRGPVLGWSPELERPAA